MTFFVSLVNLALNTQQIKNWIVMETLDSLMIVVCVIALIILLSLIAYTWVKWHKQEAQAQMQIINQPPPPAFEVAKHQPYPPQGHFQHGYLNEAGKESPNLSGSRTFLNDDVLKQKPYTKGGRAPEFQSDKVVYHAISEKNPDTLQVGDIVFHAKGPTAENGTADGVDAGHVVFNTADESVRTRRASSHSKNTYL